MLGDDAGSRYPERDRMFDAPRELVPLAHLTTLGVGGAARYFVTAENEAALSDALRWTMARDLPARVLGGGSNVVVPDRGVEGLVVRIASRGVTFSNGGDGVLVDAAAGEPWDALVAETVAHDLQGLECLSGIPGLVGATPIQNVGAYGQEVSESIVRVRALDRTTLDVVELSAADCGFGYRDSRFKSVEPERFVVLQVRFRLREGAPPKVSYPELVRRLSEQGSGRPTLAQVRDTVIALRRLKSMVLDPGDENGRSCGSFFTNPVVSEEQADRVERAARSDMPRYPQPDGRVKLAAGWLIEQAGYQKGLRRGPVGISTRHALAIVCHEGAHAEDVLLLAREIQEGVRARLGVALAPEPAIWDR
jgi:UDP-N-acetylmuramate dehydrogenase